MNRNTARYMSNTAGAGASVSLIAGAVGAAANSVRQDA